MKVITVSQLNKYVKNILENDKNIAAVYISGEISNFTNHYKSGHFYMSLKDEGALIRAVMFKAYASKIPFTPENGMKVIVKARVTLYEKDGTYQLYIEEMQPDGVGALQLAYEQIKKRLEEEGLFDKRFKKPLPKFPRKIGVITSPTGAAVRDIFNVLGRRYPLAEIVLAPVLVQGDGAPPQLIKAIRYFNEIETVDTIILGRGGGSIEDLWAFNDEQVAREVFRSKIPVISAVGHETDFTICDFVGDLRAPTPSAAAELAVPDMSQLLTYIAQQNVNLQRYLNSYLKRQFERLDFIKSKRCLSTPMYFVEEGRMRLDMLTGNFLLHMKNQINTHSRRLGISAGKLDALSPLKVLSRGYGIIHSDDGVVTKIADVTKGDRINLTLSDGSITCQVIDLVKNNQGDSPPDAVMGGVQDNVQGTEN